MAESALIRIAGLRKIYQMGQSRVHALAGVDLEIPARSFTVIMGPSGSGKSTLLYLLGGLDRPTAGHIWINGQDLTTMDENALAVYRRKMLGFVFQQFNLVPSMTAVDNVAFPLRFSGIIGRERRRRALEALKEVGLEKFTHHRPTEMSGGQQQRVAVARALVNNPPIIVADEPTGNLDTHTGFSIMQTLSQLHRQGRTVVVVTHDARMTRFATDVIYLLDGRLVSSEAFEAASAGMAGAEAAAGEPSPADMAPPASEASTSPAPASQAPAPEASPAEGAAS